MEQKLHTPEGVRDIYNDECRKKLTVQEQLHQILHLYGYQDIQTPTFEYFDVFRKEIGTISSRELYKFFDREGNTLVLRPDLTPSIARAAATLFENEEFPIRLCYMGNTFINHSSYQGRLKENTQLGAELIGIDSAEADAEMIAMVVNGLKKVGLKEFLVNIGHVDFIHSLMNAAGLDEERLTKIRTFITNRNYFGVDEILDEANAGSNIKEAFSLLPELTGGVEVLDLAEKAAPDEAALRAIQRLRRIYDILKFYNVQEYISFDLSMSGNYGYYTSVIFRAYTYGTGDALVRGGRYDHLLGKFGKDMPSIGFGIIIDELLNALSWQKVCIPVVHPGLIVYTDATMEQAVSLANEYREKGICVKLLKRKESDNQEKFIAYGKRSGTSHLIWLFDSFTIGLRNLKTGEEKRINIAKKKWEDSE